MRNEQFGAAIRSINSEDVGLIGDEMTFEEVDNLLTDKRVPESLKALLRLSDVMLVESELARAEVILGWRRSPAILAKRVGSAMAPTPLAPLCRWGGAQAGAAAYPTHDYPSVALTRTGPTAARVVQSAFLQHAPVRPGYQSRTYPSKSPPSPPSPPPPLCMRTITPHTLPRASEYSVLVLTEGSGAVRRDGGPKATHA